MRTWIELEAPTELANLDLRPRGSVHPSPLDWRDQVLYFLLPDRFSNAREYLRPAFDWRAPDKHRAPDKRAWMQAGKNWQGGTLRGIQSKLDYLKDLGVTTLWIGPIWKQRADLDTYHGYGIQNFLDIDPRFGTRQDLRNLVDAAHLRGLYIILDIIYNHTGNNWFYNAAGKTASSLPYRYQPRYDVHSWRSGTGQPTATIQNLEDGVWPREFQNLDWYTRAGSIGSWDPAGWEDPLNPNVEFRRGDFFDLKDLDLTRPEVLSAVIRVYQYWIALSDCDGYRIDTVKHIPFESSRRFCSGIREYAEAIGKENFWLLGEVTGGEYLERSYLEISGRNLDAVLDIGPSRVNLMNMCKGLDSPSAFFDQYQASNLLGSHRETGHFHVSILDDHDMVGASKRRFNAQNPIPTRFEQTAHAVGAMLTTLGVPCIYYGTEQALDGSEVDHDRSIEPNLSFEDRYIRESMFGGSFGAYRTAGCHFFNPAHPTYLRIRAINRVRNREDLIGLTLRRGRQYLREVSEDGVGFGLPGAGGIMAWSRILFNQEVLLVMNTHGLEGRSAYITVDAGLNPAGSELRVLYRSDWSDDQLRSLTVAETAPVRSVKGRSTVEVRLRPSGMMILA
jgi:glycosidase